LEVNEDFKVIRAFSKISAAKNCLLAKGYRDIIPATVFHHYFFSYKLQFIDQSLLKSKFIDLQQSEE
jgi:hypothetical protein